MKEKFYEQLLLKELEWCRENPNTDLAEDYRRGFMDGLKQAKHLIKATEYFIPNDK